jgi:membrane-bound metal-dependent hydrolase YbcI (DUF457 family)
MGNMVTLLLTDYCLLITKTMTGTTHQMIALLSGLALLIARPASLGPVVGTLAVIAVMVGALTPDLDQPTANLWRRVLGGNVIGNIFQAFSGGHRHLTHSLVGIFLVGWGLRAAAYHLVNPAYTGAALSLWTAFMIGYISHPVADSFTDQGVPWFWPLRWQVKIPPGPEEVRVTTDSFVERIIVRSGLVIIAVFLIQESWPIIKGLFQ